MIKETIEREKAVRAKKEESIAAKNKPAEEDLRQKKKHLLLKKHPCR